MRMLAVHYLVLHAAPKRGISHAPHWKVSLFKQRMFCTQCKKDVYLCKTQKELDHARSLGRCISIERVEIRMFTTGIPYRVKDTEVEQLLKEADALYASRKRRSKPNEFN